MNKIKKCLLAATVLAVAAYCAKSIYDCSEVTLSDTTMAYPDHYVSKVCDGGYTIKVEGTGQVRFDERVNDYLPTSDVTYTCESSIAGKLNSITPLNVFTPAPFNVDDFTVYGLIKKPEHKATEVESFTSRWAKERLMSLSEGSKNSPSELLKSAQKATLDAVELSLLDRVGSASAKLG